MSSASVFLSGELARRMPTHASRPALTNRSAPPATVTPVLVVPDVRAAVAWLGRAFGFEERVRIGEGHRAQLRVGADGAIVLAEAPASRSRRARAP
jgi:hypothetical protein